ncbi:sigma-54-dependent Fis family transcriptional regulator [Ornithinimicrobium tianjinense]|uniref:Fis family transcriptional regulator n=1 Tax=Ornithinimicrobium tianjinense TaxID=1195761 RepID=A0A917BRX3_9MICO|nr:helix-turn-helix domain-containing protein [Ornithinimicrobium tianjinense]GGF54448.1 Fis family transcriptional regulator [Ornithinimicrobium tianjinense]
MTDATLELARATLRDVRGSAGTVRPFVVASWQRSMEHRIDMQHLTPRYVDGAELESPLMSAAMPIIDALHEQLSNEPVGLMLTDHNGVILTRRLTHPGMATRLNRVKLAPGHVFSEASVGTNGIGTALASQRAVCIDGSEHFVEDLRPFQCAAVPVVHPTRRTVLGTFNLTTLASTSGPMAMALASSAAQQIQAELARISSHREFRLFGRYLEVCRRLRHLPVLAFNSECLMMNDRLRAVLTSVDQGALLAFVREGDLRSGAARKTTLPSGQLVEISMVQDGQNDSGHVVAVRVVSASRGRTSPVPATATIPGLVGGDAAWLRAVAEAEAAYLRRDLLAVLGEPGTGKSHLLAALHRRHAGINPVVFSPPELSRDEDAWLTSFDGASSDPRNLVVIRRSHWLSPRLRTALVDRLLAPPPGDRSRVAITADPEAVPPEDELLGLCRTRCELPPLRYRQGDLLALAGHLLRQHLPRGEHVLTSSAQTALARMTWPKNVRQLEETMRATARRASNPDRIDVTDLPPDSLVTGLVLRQLETIERDAILRGLQDRSGNVSRTARDLGIARSTLYRKLRRYGIDPLSL